MTRAHPAVRASDLAAIGAVIGVAALLLPVVGAAGDDESERMQCRNQLREIGIASIAYLTSGYGPGGREGFMPHARRLDEPDGPAHVGLVWQQLVRTGEIDRSEVFVCPSSADEAPALEDGASAHKSFAFDEADVTRSSEFSYGWTKNARTDDNSRSSTIIAADRSAGAPVGKIRNHRGGRHILYFDGASDFVPIALEVEGKAAAKGDWQLERLLEHLGGLDELNILPRPSVPAAKPHEEEKDGGR